MSNIQVCILYIRLIHSIVLNLVYFPFLFDVCLSLLNHFYACLIYWNLSSIYISSIYIFEQTFKSCLFIIFKNSLTIFRNLAKLYIKVMIFILPTCW